MASTPASGREPCAARPRKAASIQMKPLWAGMTAASALIPERTNASIPRPGVLLVRGESYDQRPLRPTPSHSGRGGKQHRDSALHVA
jgi:hypothetical protein